MVHLLKQFRNSSDPPPECETGRLPVQQRHREKHRNRAMQGCLREAFLLLTKAYPKQGVSRHDHDVAGVAFFDKGFLAGVKILQRVGGRQHGFDFPSFDIADQIGEHMRRYDG